MARLTHVNLDALAERHTVADYPSDGLVEDKRAALEAAGLDLDEAAAAIDDEPVYRLRLRDGVDEASFQAGWENVTLTASEPVFETKSQRLYLGARDLPFLVDEGPDE